MQTFDPNSRLPAAPKCIHLFGTPVLQGQLSGRDSLNADLVAAIAAERRRDNGVQRSNQDGWHSNYDMLTWGGDTAKRLARTAITQAQSMSHFEGRDPTTVRWSASMWANVSPPGSLSRSHVHPGTLWAAVYYVDMGADSNDLAVGELLLEDPRFPLAYMIVNGFHEIGPNCQPQAIEQRVKTKSGDLVVFPGYLRHRVTPHWGSRDRISVAMNITVQP